MLAPVAAVMVDSSESSAVVSEKALHLAFHTGAKRALKKPLPGFDTIDTALQDFAEGKFVVVLDNEDRENEGDLIMAADKVGSVCSSYCFELTSAPIWTGFNAI